MWWIEMRCDEHRMPDCMNERAWPMAGSEMSVKSASQVMATLRRQALDMKWVFKGGRVICPACRSDD